MEMTVVDAPDVQSAVDVPAVAYQSIPLDHIQASPYQARKEFDEENLKGLAESMRHEGLIEPIVVRRLDTSGTRFELISGERRLRAAKMLEWATIEAKVISTVSEAEASAKGLIENIQREDLNPIDEAEGFRALKDLDSYWTQEKIAEATGKSEGYISRSLSLLTLHPDIIERLRHRNLSREYGIELLRFNRTKSQKRMIEKVDKKSLSVKQLREQIDKVLLKNKSRSTPKASVPDTFVTDFQPGPAREGGAGRDPLAETWAELLCDPVIAELGSWGVEFKPRKIMGPTGPAFEAWSFWMTALSEEDPRAQLATWFERMARALKSRRARLH